jgi:hypothetical protein
LFVLVLTETISTPCFLAVTVQHTHDTKLKR